MNGGPPNPNNPGQHVWLRDGAMVTPDEYRRNRERLQHARELLTRMEQENEQALCRYSMAERELENRVAQGREAERVLAQVRSQEQTQLPSIPLLTMGSLATNGTPPTYPPAQAHSGNYGTGAASSYAGEFVQGNSRSASGVSQPHAHSSHYNPTSTQYTHPQYNTLPSTSAHQPYQSTYYPQYNYSSAQQQQPASYATAPNHSQHGSSGYPQQQHRSHYRQDYEYTSAPAPVQPPAASTSRIDEAQRHRQSQPASHVERPASRSSRESAQHSPHQPSNSAQNTPPANEGPPQDARQAYIEEMQRRGEVAEGRICELVRELPAPAVSLVFRVVIDQMKHKLKMKDGKIFPIPGIEDVRKAMTPQLTRVSDLVCAEVKHEETLSGGVMVATLQKVQARAGKTNKASASEAQATTSVQQPASSQPQQSTDASVSHPPPPSQQPPREAAPEVLQLYPAQPPQQIQLPQVLQLHPTNPPLQPQAAEQHIHPWDPNGTTALPASKDIAPSVSFSDLPPQTPQQKLNGPSFTPGRLAHDILRSLGRPSGQPPIGAVSVQPNEGASQANGKRKRSTSTAEVADKRHKSVAGGVASPAGSQSVDGNTSQLPAVPPASEDAATPAEAVVQPEHPSASQEDVRMAVIDEPEEIHTPGVIESVLNDAVAALRKTHTSPLVPAPEPASPMADAPPSSSPAPQSGASLPPSSKITTPERESAPEVAMDVSVTPVAGPSKQPLFFVSPTASDADGGPSFDDAMSDFVPSGLLAGSAAGSPRKGKERAREDSVEVLDGDDEESDVLIVGSSVPEEEALELGTEKSAPSRLPRAYVLVPPPSKELQELWARRDGQGLHGTRVVGRVVVSSDEDSDVDEIAEDFRDEETQLKEAAEARVVHDLCYNRLKAYQCRWSNCTAVLESAKRLGVHARTHAIDHEDADIYACSWEGCPREYKSKERLAHHVQKHSLHPVACAYAGCDFECWAARDMVMHHKQPKHRDQPIKPAAGPVAPSLRNAPPPLPETLPAYMAVPRPIRPARISEERHAQLAPRIAANLSTWTPLGMASDAALRPPRRPKLSDKLAASLESGEVPGWAGAGAGPSRARGAYDFWLEPRALRRVRRLCDDLPSRAVTDMFAKGLVIDTDWLARGDPGWEYHEQDADGDTDVGEDLPPSDEMRAADGGTGDVGPAGDGVSAVAEGAGELHAPRPLADDPSQAEQPGWEVLPDASEE